MTFTYLCPRARADEQGAHDINEASAAGSESDDRILYCRRCGQAVPIQDAVAATGAELDAPVGTRS